MQSIYRFLHKSVSRLRQTDPDTRFALRVAVLSSVAFCVKCILYHNVDPQLTTWVQYGQRTFRYAWWAYAFVPFLLIGIYLAIRKITSLFFRCVIPVAVIMLTAVVLSLLVFTPPTPNPGFLYFMGQLAGFCVLSVWVRYADAGATTPAHRSVPRDARIEWVRQRIGFWKGLVITGTLGFFWILVPWMNYMRADAQWLVTDRFEQYLVVQVFSVHIWLVVILMLLGPVMEAVRRTRLATNMLLELGDDRACASEQERSDA